MSGMPEKLNSSQLYIHAGSKDWDASLVSNLRSHTQSQTVQFPPEETFFLFFIVLILLFCFFFCCLFFWNILPLGWFQFIHIASPHDSFVRCCDKRISSIMLNQTKCIPAKGVFDISLFPPSKEFDMKIAQNVKSPWVCPIPLPWGLTFTGAYGTRYIQLFREGLSEKMCTWKSRKVIWDMTSTLFLTLQLSNLLLLLSFSTCKPTVHGL